MNLDTELNWFMASIAVRDWYCQTDYDKKVDSKLYVTMFIANLTLRACVACPRLRPRPCFKMLDCWKILGLVIRTGLRGIGVVE